MTDAVPIRTGGCLCGAVRYRIRAEPVSARICWCRDCQSLAGNGTVNAIFPTESLTFEGVVHEHQSRADSGNLMKRRFCPTCGNHLFANSSARPQFTAVRVGTLDDPSSVKPEVNIWSSRAPAWACMDPALAREAAQPGPPAGRPAA